MIYPIKNNFFYLSIMKSHIIFTHCSSVFPQSKIQTALFKLPISQKTLDIGHPRLQTAPSHSTLHPNTSEKYKLTHLQLLTLTKTLARRLLVLTARKLLVLTARKRLARGYYGLDSYKLDGVEDPPWWNSSIRKN